MRGILIDTHLKEVREVEVDGNNFLEEAYRLLGCEMIEVAYNFDPHPQANGTFDTIYVDENGLTTDGPKWFWTIQGGHQPFANSGLVVGLDGDTGETVGARAALEKVQSMVKFLSPEEAREYIT